MRTLRPTLPGVAAIAALTGAALLVVAPPASAQEMAPAPVLSPQIEQVFEDADIDVSGALSFDETLAVYPEVTVEQFRTADADQSDALSVGEFQVLIESIDTMAG